MKRKAPAPRKRKTSTGSKPIVDEHDHAGPTQPVRQVVPRRVPPRAEPAPRPARG